jgi:hypothetical protein
MLCGSQLSCSWQLLLVGTARLLVTVVGMRVCCQPVAAFLVLMVCAMPQLIYHG